MWKSSTLLRWGTRDPKNHLARVWVLISLIEQIGGEEEELNSGKLLQIFPSSGQTLGRVGVNFFYPGVDHVGLVKMFPMS